MYSVSTTPKFDKQIKKLDKYTRRLIIAWIEKNLEGCSNPRVHGKALSANKCGQWRYRIGVYRVICAIEDEDLIILSLSVGLRRDIYN